MRKTAICALLAVTAMLLCPSPASSRERSREDIRNLDGEAFDEAVHETITDGLDWLASTQNEDGSWTNDIGYKLNYGYEITCENGHHVGVTALACMAFLANGSFPGRGPYGENIENGLRFVLDHVLTNGQISFQGTRMYSHAFATLFLAEIFGMGIESEEVREKLFLSVQFIQSAQNAAGGWRYVPLAQDADISITVTQIMALRAAKNAGLYVPEEVIGDAVSYVRNCYDQRGWFWYQDRETVNSSMRHTFALTAAGVTCLQGAGMYDDISVQEGMEYLQRTYAHERGIPQFDSISPGYRFEFGYFYSHYYATQCYYQFSNQRPDYWNSWMDKVRRNFMAAQTSEGFWVDEVGDEHSYATAMACLVLQIPYEYLPIFQH